MVANYIIQRHTIFLKKGCFKKFIVANLMMMGLVTIFSSVFRWAIAGLFDPSWGDRLGFVMAAILCAPVSFLFKRYWVFRAHE